MRGYAVVQPHSKAGIGSAHSFFFKFDFVCSFLNMKVVCERLRFPVIKMAEKAY